MSTQSGEVPWERFPSVAIRPEARQWLEIQVMLGLANNTVQAYGRGLEDFLRWCAGSCVNASAAGRDDVARYVVDLRRRRGPRGERVVALDSGAGLSNATIQQRLTAVRLFFDYLIEEGVRDTNPVGRGRYTPAKGFGSRTSRGLVRRHKRLPWIPSDEQWRRFLEQAREEPLRNRCMLALAYDAALRREDLCALESGDIQPAHRLLRVRAETTKSGQARATGTMSCASRASRDSPSAIAGARRETQHMRRLPTGGRCQGGPMKRLARIIANAARAKVGRALYFRNEPRSLFPALFVPVGWETLYRRHRLGPGLTKHWTSISSSTTTPPTNIPRSRPGWRADPATTCIHPHLRLVDQPGRALVRAHHPAGHPPRLVLQRQATDPQDQRLRGAVQCSGQPVCLGRHRRIDPRQSRTNLLIYFRDTTLGPRLAAHCIFGTNPGVCSRPSSSPAGRRCTGPSPWTTAANWSHMTPRHATAAPACAASRFFSKIGSYAPIRRRAGQLSCTRHRIDVHSRFWRG